MKKVSNLLFQSKIIWFFIVLFSTIVYSNAQSIPEKPRLIVTIVVEQMRYDYLERFSPHFSKGGFKKLTYQGANCIDTKLNFSYSQSATGYASIATSTTPSNHGIIGNTWYNKIYQSRQNCISDNVYNCIGCKQPKSYQVSAKNLIASTYADELYISSGGKSKVFSIALEPHAAILMAGHKSTGVFWLDEMSGNWVSSNYYMQQLPEWLTSFNNKRFADLYIDRTWNTILPINYYVESLDDSSSFEIGIKNQIAFPYKISKLQDPYKPYKILKSIPFGNTFTKDVAIELIEKEQLGKDNVTDYLNISFTATQEIGDKFGCLSKEVEDTYIRLDYELMFLLNYLESTIGKDNFLLVLTSNHGVANPPKYEMQKNMSSGIFKHVESMYLLDKYLDTMFGNDSWILQYHAQQLYLNHDAINKKNIPLNEFQDAIAEFLLQLSGIQHVMTSTTMEKSDFCSNNMEHAIDNSYNKERSGDIFIQLKPGWCEQSTDIVASHVSGYTYDTHVPLFWYGWEIQPKTIKESINIQDIIVSLCSFTKTPLPNMANGKIIKDLTDNNE